MIYFDNAATTPPLSQLTGLSESVFGNPSSPHAIGISAERILEKSRNSLRSVFKLDGNLIFTSGGTESNNLAILGFSLANKRLPVTIFSEPWEHPSILEPIGFAKEHFGFSTCIQPKENWTFADGINLICISQVNHETGDINDISAIAQKIKLQNPSSIIFVDGAQGACKDFIDFTFVDMYSFSGHKIHSPTGVGVLCTRKRLRILPLFHGGGQEKNLRPGTENLDGITKMSYAVDFLFSHQEVNRAHVSKIKGIISNISNELPNVYINARNDIDKVSPYILNMSFTGIKGETLVHMLSEKGICASMGAACRSRKKVKTTLEQMGFNVARAESAIRFSFSHLNTIEEATHAKEIIIDCVSQLRRILGTGDYNGNKKSFTR